MTCKVLYTHACKRSVCVCVCVCVRACVCTCVHVWLHVYVQLCVRWCQDMHVYCMAEWLIVWPCTRPCMQGELVFRPMSYTPWPVEDGAEGERVRVPVGPVKDRQPRSVL